MKNQLKNKNVLVTGAAGFIGSHLSEKLLRLGARVVALDNLSTGKRDNVSHLLKNKNFTFIKADANIKKELEAVFKKYKIEYVFHYAAVLGVKRVLEAPLAVMPDLDGLQNICELSKKYGVKKVVFASSSEAYGHRFELPLKEDSGSDITHNQGDGVHMYALVKLMGEKIMKIYNEHYNLPTVSLRFFNVFGPRQESSDYGFVTGVFIKQILSGASPTVFGDGYQTRDFIYIEDNVDIAISALLSPKTSGEVINVGVGRQTTILDLAERLIRISGKKLKPKFIKGRRAEIKYRSPDVSKMQKLIGKKIPDNLDENLRKTYEWYESSSKTIHSKNSL